MFSNDLIVNTTCIFLEMFLTLYLIMLITKVISFARDTRILINNIQIQCTVILVYLRMSVFFSYLSNNYLNSEIN